MAARHSLTLGLAVLAACGGGTDVDPTPRVARVELEAPRDTLRSIGETVRIAVRLLDEHGAPVAATPRWSSTDPAVVSVQPDGTATALDNGTAGVVASADGVADTVVLVVRQVAVAIEILGADTVFDPGVRTRYTVNVVDASGHPWTLEPPTWSSDDPLVATAEPGLVLPLGAGTARITVAAGGLQASRNLTVVPLIDLEVPAPLAEAFQWAMVDSAVTNGVIGTSAAIHVPGVGTWRGVYGRSDGTEMIRPEMLFYPGSIVKTIVSAAALALVDDGTLALSDTVGGWLAPFQNPNIAPGITLRQLLDNTSGLFPYASHPSIGDSLFADLERIWTPREVLERFVLQPAFAPGAAWKSTNTGYVLAGMMVEAASGLPLSTVLRSRVYDAVGMEHVTTAYYETSEWPVPDTWAGDGSGTVQSAADLMTTAAHTILWPQPLVAADALAAFARALFGDFLGPGVRAEMLSPIQDDGAIPNQVAGGLGVRQYDYLGRTQWGHSGSQGAGSGFVVWDEASGIVVSLLYNQNAASHGASHFRLMPKLLEIALAARTGG